MGWGGGGEELWFWGEGGRCLGGARYWGRSFNGALQALTAARECPKQLEDEAQFSCDTFF